MFRFLIQFLFQFHFPLQDIFCCELLDEDKLEIIYIVLLFIFFYGLQLVDVAPTGTTDPKITVQFFSQCHADFFIKRVAVFLQMCMMPLD